MVNFLVAAALAAASPQVAPEPAVASPEVQPALFAVGDADTTIYIFGTFHALDGQTSVMGDPKAAIDAYEEAGQAAKTLFATTPVTQAAIDDYNTHVGTIAEFLGHQGAIAGAMDSAHC